MNHSGGFKVRVKQFSFYSNISLTCAVFPVEFSLVQSIALVSFKYSTVENINDAGNLLSVSQLQNTNLRICTCVFDDVHPMFLYSKLNQTKNMTKFRRFL